MKQIIGLASVVFFVVSCGNNYRMPFGHQGPDAEINRCLRLSASKKYEKAVECLEVFKSRYPGGNQAAEADLMIADSYFKRKEYLLAAETYQEFIRRYPFHPKQDYAYHRSGLAYLHETPKTVDRDQQYVDLAEKNFALVINFFPQSPYASVAAQQYALTRQKQAKKNYYVGRFYYKYGEYLASIPRFGEIIDQYPGLGYDEKSFYYLITAFLKTNQKDKAAQVFQLFEARHPKSSFVKDLRGKVQRI